MRKKRKTEEIRRDVDEFYRQVARGERKTKDQDALHHSLGYGKDELIHLPEEVKMGLGCGNPLTDLHLHPGESLLDLGCGKGMDLMIARKKWPEAGMLYGVDRLPEMVERAKTIAEKRGFQRISFYQAPITELPLPEASVDRVISNCVINLEPDKKRVYEEIYRVLRPGGSFHIRDIVLKKPLSEELVATPDIYGT